MWTHIHAATACSLHKEKRIIRLGGGGGWVGSLKKTIFSGLGFIVKCPNGEMSESAKPVQVDVLITCPMGYVDVWVC